MAQDPGFLRWCKIGTRGVTSTTFKLRCGREQIKTNEEKAALQREEQRMKRDVQTQSTVNFKALWNLVIFSDIKLYEILISSLFKLSSLLFLYFDHPNHSSFRHIKQNKTFIDMLGARGMGKKKWAVWETN